MKQNLSPRDLAEAIGVSESSLKRWADEGLVHVSRTAGGHRRITITEAIRYIRKSGLPIVNPQALGIADLSSLPAEDLAKAEHNDRAVVDAVLGGLSQRVRGLLLSMYLTGRSIAEICDGPITHAMHVVGDLWRHSDEGIMIEHRATDICAQALHQLRGLLPTPADDAPFATGGAPAGDSYMLTSLMATIVLAADGWREVNLGPQTPSDILFRAAQSNGAKLVWQSFSVDLEPGRATREILELGAKLTSIGAALAVGGRALPPRQTLAHENVHVISNMCELAAFARGLRVAGAPSATENVQTTNQIPIS